jgi:hypothetical protein
MPLAIQPVEIQRNKVALHISGQMKPAVHCKVKLKFFPELVQGAGQSE